jgi:hypothetical protein
MDKDPNVPSAQVLNRHQDNLDLLLSMGIQRKLLLYLMKGQSLC